jgi:outer membrane immunogenic protein
MHRAIGVLLAGAAFGILSHGAASAADLRPIYKAPPPVVAPAFSWTGFYVGGNVGYGWGEATDPGIGASDPFGVIGFGPFAAAGGFQYPNLKPSGVIGGGQVGYNWQAGSWVYGLVADIQGSDMKASGTALVAVGPTTTVQTISAQENWLATFRARLGFAVNNVLFYGTGGLAVGEVNSTLGFTIPTVPGPGGTFAMAGSQTSTQVGWAAGAGVEYAVSRNWSLGAEYLHFDLGRDTVTATTVVNTTGTPVGPATVSASQRFSGDIARGMINYRF